MEKRTFALNSVSYEVSGCRGIYSSFCGREFGVEMLSLLSIDEAARTFEKKYNIKIDSREYLEQKMKKFPGIAFSSGITVWSAEKRGNTIPSMDILFEVHFDAIQQPGYMRTFDGLRFKPAVILKSPGMKLRPVEYRDPEEYPWYYIAEGGNWIDDSSQVAVNAKRIIRERIMHFPELMSRAVEKNSLFGD